jgi:hypothetical protein
MAARHEKQDSGLGRPERLEDSDDGAGECLLSKRCSVRWHEDFGKAYEHFSDPEWDGEPEDPVVPVPRPVGGEEEPGEDDGGEETGGEEGPVRRQRIKIRLADGKERTIQSMMATSFWSPDGRPMSAAEFVERLFGALPALFKDEDALRALWSQPDTRAALLAPLDEQGFGGEQLREIERLVDAEKSDLYVVLAYIAFALAPMTREARVVAWRGAIFLGCGRVRWWTSPSLRCHTLDLVTFCVAFDRWMWRLLAGDFFPLPF